MKTLELKDICGYLPHGLCANIEVCDEINLYRITSMGNSIISVPIKKGMIGYSKLDISDITPILRPLSDLYKTITHNGKEIVPIVELAKMAFPWKGWYLENNKDSSFRYAEYDTDFEYIKFWFSEDGNGFKTSRGDILNQYQLFDFLQELKIDYRGLISKGLAVSAYDLEINPYK